MKSRITIDNLSNHCRFIGKSEDYALVASEVRQLAEAQLPDAIDAEINRQLQMLLDQDGLYRIRELKLNFTITRRDLSARKLGVVLARQLVSALEKQLANRNGDIVYFDSEAEFFASLMSNLLLGNHKDAWVYEDYAALRHLSPIDAVVQLLLPRFRDLPQLAAGLQRRDALATLLRMLSETHAHALVLEWSGQTLQTQFREDVAPALEQLLGCQAWLGVASVGAIDNDVSLAVASVRHMLSCLGVATPQMETNVVLWAVLHRVFLNRYRHEISALVILAFSARVETGDYSHLDADVIPIAKDLLQWVGTSEQRRDYIERLLRRGTARQVISRNIADNKAQEIPKAPSGERVLFRNHAGLVLLIPVLISLRLQASFSMTMLRRALHQTLTDEPVQDVDEACLQILLPDNQPQPVADGKLPAGWQLGLSAERQTQIETLTGSEQISQLLLAHFAARLSGLQRSSNEYLRRQFLQISGHLVVDDLQIVAHLESIPLYIVLRMSGLAGWSDRVPWLKRQLTIEIPPS